MSARTEWQRQDHAATLRVGNPPCGCGHYLVAGPDPHRTHDQACAREFAYVPQGTPQGSSVFIMDEPTANLDYGNQVRILHTIRTLAQQRYSILLTSHVPDHAFLVCNQVALLTNGRLQGPGSPQEIITDQALSKLYDTAMRVLHVQLPECPAADLSLCVALMNEWRT